jgi:hypothetical protein
MAPTAARSSWPNQPGKSEAPEYHLHEPARSGRNTVRKPDPTVHMRAVPPGSAATRPQFLTRIQGYSDRNEQRYTPRLASRMTIDDSSPRTPVMSPRDRSVFEKHSQWTTPQGNSYTCPLARDHVSAIDDGARRRTLHRGHLARLQAVRSHASLRHHRAFRGEPELGRIPLSRIIPWARVTLCRHLKSFKNRITPPRPSETSCPFLDFAHFSAAGPAYRVTPCRVEVDMRARRIGSYAAKNPLSYLVSRVRETPTRPTTAILSGQIISACAGTGADHSRARPTTRIIPAHAGVIGRLLHEGRWIL